jgi:FKBP-type peptidyl-prolyl cis-trans isomerase
MKLLKAFFIPVFGVVIALTSCNNNPTNVSIKTETDSLSYALGINIAASLKQGELNDINALALAKAISEVYNKNEKMTNDEAVEFINKYFAKERDRKAKENLEKGQKFLEENAKNEGIIVDPSGIQYRVIVEGNGPKPTETDVVKVHYHGTLIDGTVFDSTVEREQPQPAQFSLNRVIKGWTIGVQKMSVGSKYVFYIPAELAYGANPRPGGAIKPNEVLIFEVELLDIIKE